jgi:hypothetical protein
VDLAKAPPDLPLVVGVTSHRNMAAAEVEPMRQLVRDFFAHLRQEFPELPLVVLSALAEGGDQLVAREALGMGAKLIAPLPLPLQSYVSDFTDEASRAEFVELCERAEALQLPSLPGNTQASIDVPGQARDRQYAQAGVFISSHCHILLALWDGRESDLLGGTAQVVRFHLSGIMPGLIERRRGPQMVLDRGEESLIYHIACSRSDEHSAVQPPLAPLQPLQARWISLEEERAATTGMPDEFQRMFTCMREFNIDRQRYEEDISIAAAHAESETAGYAGDAILDGLFVAADWLALHFQKRVLLAMRSIHILAALTGVAFVCYSDLPTDLPLQFYFIYVFIVLFGAGVVLAQMARRRDWHRKYVDYRALAEGLRVQRWWLRAGTAATSSSAFAHDNFMQKQDIELGWIRNVMRAASVNFIDGATVPVTALEKVIREWIGKAGAGGQLDYYARKTEHLSRMHQTTRNLGSACLWLGVAIGVFLALFQSRLGADNTTSLVAVMGVLAIVAAARESYAYRKGDKELIKQYRYMHGIFAAARMKLDATQDAESQREILRALGETALAEHSEWALMHRERPLEQTRF